MSWLLESLEFRIREGSVAPPEVHDATDTRRIPPATLQLERYEHPTWAPVGTATSTEGGAGTDLPPDTKRRLSYRLPDQTEPTYHRLLIIEETHEQVSAQFWYAGDLNQ